MYRIDTRNPPMISRWTSTACVSIAFTVAGVANQSIYLGGIQVTWDASQATAQAIKVFEGATQVFHATGSGTEKSFVFYNPIHIRPGNNLLVTASCTAVDTTVNLSLQYLQE